ncbi:MAG: hypothetical protein QOG53_3560 [Frankiales bacterium]|jgi:hypothetical protein|nr:hypothetical protein [Frankiales bacterium]
MTAETRLESYPAATQPPRSVGGRRRGHWWIEILIAVVGYELYSAVQSMTTGHIGALAHAEALVRLEKHLHIWIEPTLNHWATAHAFLGIGAGYYYELTHVLGTAATLIFLWWRRREFYFWLRNVLIAMSLPALFVYWLWPVAPPRLSSAGFTDTLVAHNILGAAHVHGGFVNLYAAMPSLHVAWAVWCAAAIVVTTRSRWKHLAWIYPALTTFAVLTTANHFVLDAVAGAALAVLAFAVWRPRSARLQLPGD